MDDLSTYLGDPVNDVQGFLTKKVTFSEGLFKFGQTVRADNTPANLESSLTDVVFYFRTVQDNGGVKTALAATNRLYGQGAATARWPPTTARGTMCA